MGALHQAASMGNVWMVHQALKRDANALNERDETGLAPLHYAVNREKWLTVARLLKAGADPQLTDGHGSTPLVLAAIKGNSRIVELLLKSAPSASQGGHALLLAAEAGHIKVVERLVNAGVDLTVSNQAQRTPLLLAAREKRLEVAIFLTSKMHRQALGLDQQDETGRTALHHAAIHHLKPLIKALIDAGAQVNCLDKKSKTALDWARISANSDVICPMLEACGALDGQALAQAQHAEGREDSSSAVSASPSWEKRQKGEVQDEGFETIDLTCLPANKPK